MVHLRANPAGQGTTRCAFMVATTGGHMHCPSATTRHCLLVMMEIEQPCIQIAVQQAQYIRPASPSPLIPLTSATCATYALCRPELTVAVTAILIACITPATMQQVSSAL